MLAYVLTCFAMNAMANEITISIDSWEESSQDEVIVNLHDLNGEQVKAIMEGKCPECAVEFTKGTCLPISLFLRGDLLNLKEKDQNVETIEVKQTFYVRCIEKKFLFSFDRVKWKPYSELITGTSFISLNIQDGEPAIVIGVETNRRP